MHKLNELDQITEEAQHEIDHEREQNRCKGQRIINLLVVKSYEEEIGRDEADFEQV